MDAAEALERLSNEVAAAVAHAGLAGLAPEEIVVEASVRRVKVGS